MVLHRDWHSPAMLRNVRSKITFILWVILLCILWMNAATIFQFFKNIFN